MRTVAPRLAPLRLGAGPGRWLVVRLVCLALAGAGRLPAAVEPPPGFAAETLATGLNAATALAVAADGRVFVADQTGKVRLWRQGALLPQPVLSLHVTDYWERGLIGLALSPDFPRTPHLFALYVTDRPFVHHVLSRFTLAGDTADPAGEVVLLEGDDQAKLGGGVPAGHQGGPLRFGPGGKLFVSLGEQTAGEPSQSLQTLQGKILRLDPDGGIPADNPFAGRLTGKYRSIFAYGVRNCFGIALQPETGRMFFTDVGSSVFEEVNELVPGVNYGWPFAEGFSTNTAFKQPLHAYSPLVGQSVVGGAFVRRDSPWPARWRGRFLFADFVKGWVKALDPDAPTNLVSFARGLNGPVATEFAPDGSLLVLARGALWRDPTKFVADAGSLVRIRYTGEAAPAADPGAATGALGLPVAAGGLPKKLRRAEWDLRLRGAPHWPVWLNSRAWLPDVREAPATLYLPAGASVALTSASDTVRLPPGAVVVREFAHAVPSGWERFETRLLMVGAGLGWGASYRWHGEEAELVEDGELETLPSGGSAPAAGGPAFNWWFPALDDALSTPVVNPCYWISLAPSDFVARGGTNVLAQLRRAGALDSPLTVDVLDALPPGVSWSDPEAPLEPRIRSYLHGNCSVCHQPGGSSRGLYDARLGTPLVQAGILDGPLAAGDLGIPGARVVVPGAPEKSVLVRRLADAGLLRMPPVQYHTHISPILPYIEEWIRRLPHAAAP